MQIDLKDYPWNQRIRILRTIKNWTQKEAAKKCNVSDKVYWSWEVGESYPHKNNRVALAKAFGVSEEEIFSSPK